MLKLKIKGFFLLSVFLTSSVCAQADIESADSLFTAQKYTEALEIYEEVYNGGMASSAMLLKMSFIKEGLRDHVSALYFLNAYYEMTYDKAVLHKMEEIALENNLSGYEVGDEQFFLTNLSRHKTEIQSLLALIAAVLLLVTFTAKRKNRLVVGVPVIQVIVLVALLTVSNGWLEKNRAIVVETTLLMNGPSPAAEVVEQISKGHLVQIIDESDVWAKVIWEGEEMYLRKGRLLKL